MAIRIDGNRSTPDTEATRRAEAAQKQASAASSGQVSGSDRLEVSGTAHLLAAALQAANDAPSARPDAIERARELLRSGDLGRDTQALAEAIVDRLIEE
jgi:hypothetical protein